MTLSKLWLPLASIQTSGVVSDDLRKMRMKEGKLLTRTNMNQLSDDNLENNRRKRRRISS